MRGVDSVLVVFAHPRTEKLDECVRALEWRGVPCRCDDGGGCVLTDISGHLRRKGSELRVALPGNEKDRHRKATQPLAVVDLGSGSEPTERVGEAGRRVLFAGFASLGRGRQIGKHRLSEPFVQEPGERKWISIALKSIGEGVIGAPAIDALAFVLDPGRDTDEHHRSHGFGRHERRVQDDAATHRVPDVGRPTHRFGDLASRLLEARGADRRRPTVSGKVDGHDFESRTECIDDRLPRSASLGKAVKESDAVARPKALGGERRFARRAIGHES